VELDSISAAELDSGATAELEEASLRPPPLASAEEFGLAKDCAGNCGLESVPQLAQKSDATDKQLKRQNFRMFIQIPPFS
jgi:hypothetical protein